MTARHMRDGGPSAAARIAGVGTALPSTTLTQAEALALLEMRCGATLAPRSLHVMRKVFAHPSVATRHFAVDDPHEVLDEDADRRIARFTSRATDLSRAAAQGALAAAGISAASLGAVIVNTCTGYVCPGLSTYLAERLSLPRTVRTYDLVGAGCGGAVPNLQLASGLAAGGGAPILCVSVEICSATFRMGDDLGLIVSNALFGDGAGACVVGAGGQGPEIVDSESMLAPEYREDIRYVHRGGQLQNQLSLDLPRTLARETPAVVEALLSRHGLGTGDVEHWAIHPGGDKVVRALGGALGLGDDRLAVTRGVLHDIGNVSSATVWFELERILAGRVDAGSYIVMLAAGAGLSIHAALLRA